jgi:hypothetical protein
MKRTIGVAAMLVEGFSALLCGQATGPQLSLQDAHALALKNHPQVLAS